MEEYGLILCGGGGRGAYQIGVWRALERLGLRKYITAVSGTSAGALNAAMFVTVSCSRAADIWRSITTEDIADISDAAGRVLGSVAGLISSEGRDLPKLAGAGLFGRDGMTELIESNGISRGVGSSDIPVFACCHNSSLRKAEYFDLRAYPHETVTKLLTASSAIPGVFPEERIGLYRYRDGGLSDNIPVRPLYDIGYRKFIISYLSRTHINRSLFPDAELIELLPSDDIYLDGSDRSILTNGTLDFNGRHAAVRIELGERETLAHFMKSTLL